MEAIRKAEDTNWGGELMARIKDLLGGVLAIALAGGMIILYSSLGINPLTFPQDALFYVLRTASAYAQSENEKVWMVADFADKNGRPAQMSFNNPSLPNLTLKECQGAIENARPFLTENIRSVTGFPAASITKIECVASASDPIKPRP